MDGVTIRLLGPQDADWLLSQEEGLFDAAPIPEETRAFLADPLSFLVVAEAGGALVGFASGTLLRHPDKRPALFVNEVSVREAWQGRGIGRALMAALIAGARSMGSEGIWVATEEGNAAARALYRAAGGRETEGIVVYDWDGAMDPA